MKDGGPAFPSVARDGNWPPSSNGMSLRDYFASKAMQGMTATMSLNQIHDRANGVLGGAIFAKAAYILADAMLDEREKT